MASHEVAAHAVGRAQAGFEVNQRAHFQVTEISQPEGFSEEIKSGYVSLDGGRGQAAAIDSDGGAEFGGGQQGRLER